MAKTNPLFGIVAWIVAFVTQLVVGLLLVSGTVVIPWVGALVNTLVGWIVIAATVLGVFMKQL